MARVIHLRLQGMAEQVMNRLTEQVAENTEE